MFRVGERKICQTFFDFLQPTNPIINLREICIPCFNSMQYQLVFIFFSRYLQLAKLLRIQGPHAFDNLHSEIGRRGRPHWGMRRCDWLKWTSEWVEWGRLVFALLDFFVHLFLDNIQVAIINIVGPVIGGDEIFECVFKLDDVLVNYIVIAFGPVTDCVELVA